MSNLRFACLAITLAVAAWPSIAAEAKVSAHPKIAAVHRVNVRFRTTVAKAPRPPAAAPASAALPRTTGSQDGSRFTYDSCGCSGS